MPPKPPSQPRPKRLPKGKPMTIAACFDFDEGALLCADTKHTGGMTLYEPKLFRKEYPNGAKSVLAFSGSTHYAKMAVQKCETAIARLPNRPRVQEVADAIESALVRLHRTHIDKHPDRSMEGGPDFWLLAALWSPVDGLKTYSTSQTAIVPFDVYACIGSGEYLGHYIIKPRYDSPSEPLNRAVAVAVTALQRIKSYDSGCGGYSQFVTMAKSGALSEVAVFDIAEKEQFTHEFHQGAEAVYTKLLDFDAPDKDVEKVFEEFRTNVLLVRAKHQADRDERERITQLLSRLRIKRVT